jgi:hypothetical protein
VKHRSSRWCSEQGIRHLSGETPGETIWTSPDSNHGPVTRWSSHLIANPASKILQSDLGQPFSRPSTCLTDPAGGLWRLTDHQYPLFSQERGRTFRRGPGRSKPSGSHQGHRTSKLTTGDIGGIGQLHVHSVLQSELANRPSEKSHATISPVNQNPPPGGKRGQNQPGYATPCSEVHGELVVTHFWNRKTIALPDRETTIQKTQEARAVRGPLGRRR